MIFFSKRYYIKNTSLNFIAYIMKVRYPSQIYITETCSTEMGSLLVGWSPYRLSNYLEHFHSKRALLTLIATSKHISNQNPCKCGRGNFSLYSEIEYLVKEGASTSRRVLLKTLFLQFINWSRLS